MGLHFGTEAQPQSKDPFIADEQKWSYSYSKQGEEVIIFHYDKSD